MAKRKSFRLNYKTKRMLLALVIFVIVMAVRHFFPQMFDNTEDTQQELVLNESEVSLSTYEPPVSDSSEYSPQIEHNSFPEAATANPIAEVFDYESMVPEWDGESSWVAVNGNVPYFTDEEKASYNYAFEYYGELDDLGRCTTCTACLDQSLMPTEKRGDISMVHPSGWKSIKMDFVDGGWLYNRCHLIGYQLADENANELNLITGTRYLNVIGMLPFENMVADYIKEENELVLYRVTPIFVGDELVARGVLMEGWSLADDGESICYCAFCYNVQPDVKIDYETGSAWEK